jgi:DNA-binding transcriptional LysR family regulator
VLDRGCWWSKLPVNVLVKEQRAFNVTFKSESFSNLRCAIRAGLAVGVLPARAIQSGMRVSPARRDLPGLPAMARSLLIAPGSPPEITRTIAAALKDGLSRS